MAPADKTVGRTPWDVASEVLTRLGPMAIMVLGFLAFIVFIYLDTKEDSKEQNKFLIESLEKSQDQIVNNTKKMGEMSQKMIENIGSLLELRTTVTKNATAQKNKFDADIREAETIHTNLLAEIEKTEEELKAQEKKLQAQEKKLRDRYYLLKEAEKAKSASAKDVERERNALEKVIEEHAEQIAALKSKLSGSEGTAPTPVDSEAATVRKILAAYAEDPEDESVQKLLQQLVGLRLSVLEDIVTKDDLGYSTWFRDRSDRIFGYLQQMDVGPRNYIKVFNKSGTITRVTTVLSNVFVRIPKAENWYESWLCDVVATQKRLTAVYFDNDSQEWTQIELKVKNPTVEPLVYTKKELVSFKVTTYDKLQTLFPKQYKEWKTRKDSYGRPGLILEMIDRSKNFNANEIDGLQSPALPENLRATIVNIMNAAVAGNRRTVERHLDAGEINRNRMGEIAAIALRNPRIVDVADKGYKDRGNNEVSRWLVTLRYDALRRGSPKTTMTFSKAFGAWTLIDLKEAVK